jgi:hypothetical protein
MVGWRPHTETEEDTRAAKRQQLVAITGDEGLFDEDDEDDDADVAGIDQSDPHLDGDAANGMSSERQSDLDD